MADPPLRDRGARASLRMLVLRPYTARIRDRVVPVLGEIGLRPELVVVATTTPAHAEHVPRAGDVAAVAVHGPDREAAHTRLRASGWLPVEPEPSAD